MNTSAITPSNIKTVVGQIVRKYRPLQIIIFGSCASGKASRDSDCDLLIIKKTKRRFIERISDVLALCDTEIPLEPIVYTPDEVARRMKSGDFFLKEIFKQGKIIYG